MRQVIGIVAATGLVALSWIGDAPPSRAATINELGQICTGQIPATLAQRLKACKLFAQNVASTYPAPGIGTLTQQTMDGAAAVAGAPQTQVPGSEDLDANGTTNQGVGTDANDNSNDSNSNQSNDSNNTDQDNQGGDPN